jgi:hypothetical protein
MGFEQIYEQWAVLGDGAEAQYDALRNDVRAILQSPSRDDFTWLLTTLESVRREDERRRHMIRAALYYWDQMPDALFPLVIRAAVYDHDPSFVKMFVVPCLRHSGPRRVNEELLQYFENGTDAEKAGAANAFYHAMQRNYEGVASENIANLVARVRHLFLTEYVSNEDVEVRRSILGQLPLEPEYYPEEMHPLLQQAVELSRAHTDEYIRHRIEIQLGHGGLLMSRPGPIEESTPRKSSIVARACKWFGL